MGKTLPMTPDDVVRSSADLVVRATAIASRLDSLITRMQTDAVAVEDRNVIEHMDRVLDDLDRHIAALTAIYEKLSQEAPGGPERTRHRT